MDYIIETNQLTKLYKGTAVVDNVHIHVKKGEIYGFVGPNGAGKSTLMKMLLNLTKPDRGEILLFGSKVMDGDFEMLKKIGSIIENPYFYEQLTGEQNLNLHCEYMGYHNKEKIQEVLKIVQLSLDANKKVVYYSLGMKQRLAIARAIITKPELLILDEPINALDPEGISEMRDLFQTLNVDYGITIFISSHILSEVERIADTIGIIRNGKLLKEIAMSDIRDFQADYICIEVDCVQRAGCILEDELGITNFKVVSDTTLEIYDYHNDIKNISACMVQNDIGILSIGRKQNTLEDYFFQITEEENII